MIGDSVVVEVDFQPHFDVAVYGSFYRVDDRHHYSVDFFAAYGLFGEQTGFDGAGRVIADG